MGIVLLHQSGSLKGCKTELDKGVLRLGRKPDNEVSFLEDAVSGYHAEIRATGSAFSILDLQSMNGTFVNGQRIKQIDLRDHDRIELGEGGPAFEVRIVRPPGSDQPRITPVSGAWEKIKEHIELKPGITTLGRGRRNLVVVGRNKGSVVSLEHAEIEYKDEHCQLEDLESSNGTFVNGERVRKAQLFNGDKVELGKGGPVFMFVWNGHDGTRDRFEANKVIDRKPDISPKGRNIGERTRVIWREASRYYKRRRRPLLILCGLAILASVITGALYYLQRQRNVQLAEDKFYLARSLDAALVKLRMQESNPNDVERAMALKRKAIEDYDKFLEELGVYKGKREDEKAVMKLARELGETNLEIPSDFLRLTLEYVAEWRKKENDLRARIRNAYQRIGPEQTIADVILEALRRKGLPDEFLFLALWESGFNYREYGIEIPDRGIAKGLWQFIPKTGEYYNLRIGPWVNERRYDPDDHRHDVLRSTDAAARFLAELYAGKANASGLLVMASYNYGQTRIVRKLNELEKDPGERLMISFYRNFENLPENDARARSFWNFYRNGWLPPETRQYVMRIFSAALICKNPRTFGFEMDPFPGNASSSSTSPDHQGLMTYPR